ncbi:MAG: hypothetical protein IKF97_05740 [Clostridia bacterium]|nr:hypothetical protein [Clostridia bacterium]
MDNKLYKIVYYIVFLLILSIFSIFISVLLDNILSSNTDFFINGNLTIKNIIESFIHNEKPKKLFFIIELIFILMLGYLYIQSSSLKNNVSRRKEVAKGIKTPVAVGERTIWNSNFYGETRKR